MPKIVESLTDIAIKNLEIPPVDKRPYTVAVGGESGLLIQVSPTGVKSWILRVMIGGKRREIRLGIYPRVSMKVARDKAREMKDKIRQGVDPAEERKAAKRALAVARLEGLSFGEVMTEYLQVKLADKDAKTQKSWTNTLEKYAKPILSDFPIEEIDVNHVLRVIEPIWSGKTETAKRVRMRIEAILDYAMVKGYRKTGNNPARWDGHLKMILPEPSKINPVVNKAAIPVKDVQGWFAKLKKRDGMKARALEFLTLTAARNGEIRGALWSEIDMNNSLWVIPAARMKMRKDHRVSLSDSAVALLQATARGESPYIFPAVNGGEMPDHYINGEMANMHTEEIASGGKGWFDSQSGEKCVPHGLRSTFRDWGAECTEYPSEILEASLSHHVGTNVEKAYRRGDFLEKRRAVMQDWDNFLKGGK